MNRAVLVLCGVVVVACTGAWSQQPAAADQQAPCPTDSTASSCQMTPNAQGPTTYTVSKQASPSAHVQPGETVTYTVTVHATADSPAAGFTDVLHDVLDDAGFGSFVGDSQGATVDGEIVSWAGNLTEGQTVSISYSVTVDNPDRGDGLLRNDVKPSSDHGECESCAVTNAVAGTFTVRESASPQSGSTVHPGDTVNYTVDVVGGDAPTYASFADSLSANADYAGDAQASDGTVSVHGNTVSWTGKLAARATATITFSARVSAAGDTDQLISTVQPIDNEPYQGSCAAGGACQVSYRVVAPAGPTDTTSTTPSTTATVSATSAPTTGPSRSDSAVAGAGPTTSLPHIADTGAKSAGLSKLAAVLLFGGLGLLVLGRAPRRRPRHRH